MPWSRRARVSSYRWACPTHSHQPQLSLHKPTERREKRTSSRSSNASLTLSALNDDALLSFSMLRRFEMLDLTAWRCSSATASRPERVSCCATRE